VGSPNRRAGECGAQLNDLCSPKTRFSRPMADSTIRFRHGVEVAVL
jgi:hypothetical protein